MNMGGIALERVLNEAGVRGTRNESGLAYGPFDPAYFSTKDFSLDFSPLFPIRSGRARAERRR
jgi:hypothetical protein